jgi:hypothetical protein
MSIEVEASGEGQSYEYARRLSDLLKGPLVKMAVEAEGIRLAGDGHPVVYAPQREFV